MQLNFHGELQLADLWCWAAVSASVDHYFNVPPQWRQCEIADGCLHLPAPCCPDPRGGPCDQNHTLQHALSVVDHFLNFAPPPTFAQVRNEIETHHKPVCLRIEWTDGAGHFVTIYGCDIDPILSERYLVADPITGPALWYSEEDVMSNYQGSGRCTDAFYLTPTGAPPNVT
jgi:Papain-like cysteine protease AvrRpt2